MKFEFRDGYLFVDGEQVPNYSTPNKTPHATNSMKGCVHHSTAGRLDVMTSVNWIRKRKARASAHFFVGRGPNPKIIQIGRVTDKLWHAGPSRHKGIKGLNNHTFGIEYANPGRLQKIAGGMFRASFKAVYRGSKFGIAKAGNAHIGSGWFIPEDEDQIQVGIGICKAAKKAYPAFKWNASHAEIDTRGWKEDATPHFPFDRVDAEVFGGQRSEPKPKEKPLLSTYLKSTGVRVELAYMRLQDLGYPVGADDGIFGDQMRAATLEWQAVNERSITGALDDADWRFLVDGDSKPKPIGATRAAAEEEDLHESDTVKKAQAGRSAAEGCKWLGGGLVGFNALEAVTGEIQGVAQVITGFKEAVGSIFEIIPLQWALPIALFAVWYFGRKFFGAQVMHYVQKYRGGEIFDR